MCERLETWGSNHTEGDKTPPNKFPMNADLPHENVEIMLRRDVIKFMFSYMCSTLLFLKRIIVP